MKKLTSKDIAFIDTYLKKAGVEFLDIRVEMTDHVASAIEQEMEQQPNLTFYSAFKSYMIRYKKSLLKNAKKQKWSIDWKVLLNIKNELFKMPGLLIGGGFLAILSTVNMAQLEENLWFQILVLVVFLTAYLVPVILYSKLKISFLVRLSVYAYLINYGFFMMMSHLEISPHWLGLVYGILVWLNTGVLLSAFKMSAHYKKIYFST